MIWWILAVLGGAAAVAFLARGMGELGQRIEQQKSTHDAIDALRRSGFDFEAARDVEFTLSFPTVEAAQSAASDLRALQYVVTVADRMCLAHMTVPPALAGDRRTELEGVAAKFGGEYEGWAVG